MEMEFKAEELVTKQQPQAWLGITVAQRLAFHDRGLPYIKVGNAVLYHLPAVCAWLKGQERRRPAWNQTSRTSLRHSPPSWQIRIGNQGISK